MIKKISNTQFSGGLPSNTQFDNLIHVYTCLIHTGITIYNMLKFVNDF